ncbi:MAG: T9SS type A sorting domain-containing protein [Bacteroidales bacterium]|nr:T9SS type A sorting domain-containing protein [Bacteroidales bacterium]
MKRNLLPVMIYLFSMSLLSVNVMSQEWKTIKETVAGQNKSLEEVTFTKVTTGPVVNDGGWNYGMIWCDVDQDGLSDLFVVNNDANNGKHNFLYINNGGGTFTKVTEGVIVNDSGSSYAATAAMIGSGIYNIGIFVANHNENNCLYLRDGNGTFTKITDGIIVNDGGKSVGAAWADYDRDNLLDLYVVNRDQKNFLYHNLGNGTFEKITTGAIVNDIANSSVCAWGDYNNDGYPDLYVANAGAPGCLYKNNGDGTFTKVQDVPFISDISSCAGASWGDANNDGYLDLFVSTGLLGMYNNWFYLNNGDGTFAKVTDSPLVSDVLWSSGSAWGDFDKDGHLDLAVGGYDGNNLLFRNDRNGGFIKVENNAFVNDGNYTMGLAWADIDNDGDLDIFTAKNNYFGGNNSLFLNDGNENNWLKVLVQSNGIYSTPDCIGVRVEIKATIFGQPVTQVREISSQTGGGQGGQGEFTQFFGLGDATQVDTLRIYLDQNNPIYEEFSLTSINKLHFILIDPWGIGEDSKVNSTALQVYPNPADHLVTLSIAGNQNHINFTIMDMNGRVIEQSGFTGNETILDISNFKPGFYFIRMMINGVLVTKKLAVM